MIIPKDKVNEVILKYAKRIYIRHLYKQKTTLN